MLCWIETQKYNESLFLSVNKQSWYIIIMVNSNDIYVVLILPLKVLEKRLKKNKRRMQDLHTCTDIDTDAHPSVMHWEGHWVQNTGYAPKVQMPHVEMPKKHHHW